MDLTQLIEIYKSETGELLQDMEKYLLLLEDAPHDAETVNALFRAAHTIKGSSGTLGHSQVALFTHVMENVLERVRGGNVAITGRLIDLLLKCKDHIATLMEALDDSGSTFNDPLDGGLAVQNETLVRELGVHLANATPETPIKETPQTGQPIRQDISGKPQTDPSQPPQQGTQGGDYWHISLRFGRKVLQDGMDPLSFLTYLTKFGTIESLATIHDALPSAADMDPEQCYLGFEIDFSGNVDKSAIEEVFEFVKEDCDIRILPPHSTLTSYVQLIQELPEDTWKLGDILVRSGVVSAIEIEEALSRQEGKRKTGTDKAPKLGEVLVAEGLVDEKVVEAALNRQERARSTAAAPDATLRVDADKLDRLINIVGELVIAGGGIRQRAMTLGDSQLLRTSSFMTKLVKDARDMSMKMRMVPIGSAFNRFQRLVRDVGKELGKEIELVITGADTEIDKNMVEKIGDPLTHLVRNAIDHGIETPDERAALGKPSKGTLRLHAFYDAGSIAIEVSDDGKGLNKERIKQKAIEKGLITADKSLTEKETFDLIFEPGFSTASQVSSLSGRGVGMDVVKRNITALRGFVIVESKEGEGATIRIHLPLTLSIIEGFMVGIGEGLYVIPLDMVVKCFSLTKKRRQEIRTRNYFDFNGKVIPYFCLAEMFGVKTRKGYCNSLLVAHYAGQSIALAVDAFYGDMQAVIKPLGRLYGKVDTFSGATILGDGRVALIVDIPKLMQMTGAL